MFRTASKIFIASLLISSFAYGQDKNNFPNVTGSVLFETQGDRVVSTNKKGVSPNNAFIYIEPNISLNFNKNWSAKTQWRFQPNNVLTTRNQNNPERYRTFLQSNRGVAIDDNGLIVEELKINFENEDMNFFAGKFDPKFGSGHKRNKRIGIFTSQFNEDYNLREKIGAGFGGDFESSNFQFSSFFNDETGLSRSAIDDRGRANKNKNIAGNTGTISSYAFNFEGEDFFLVDNLFYGFGYRSLGVDKNQSSARENGYVFNLEYLHKFNRSASIVPFFEAVKISNFTGEKNRDAKYVTMALIGNYSNWTSSISFLNRDIKQKQRASNISDRQFQTSIGYKFTNNVTLDFTRSIIKEDRKKGSLFGFNLSYLYKF